MPSKKHKPEEIIGKLREAEIVLAQGASAAEACRRIEVSELTFGSRHAPAGLRCLTTGGARNMVASRPIRRVG